MKDCSSQHSIFLLAFVILLTETAPAYLSQSRILLSTAHAQPQKLSVSMDLPSGNSRDINNSITQVEMSRDVEGRQKFKAVEWMKTLPTAAAATPSLSMRRLRMQAVRRLFPFNRRRRCARHQSTCALRWNRIQQSGVERSCSAGELNVFIRLRASSSFQYLLEIIAALNRPWCFLFVSKRNQISCRNFS